MMHTSLTVDQASDFELLCIEIEAKPVLVII